jgi:hypothetical protein
MSKQEFNTTHYATINMSKKPGQHHLSGIYLAVLSCTVLITVEMVPYLEAFLQR